MSVFAATFTGSDGTEISALANWTKHTNAAAGSIIEVFTNRAAGVLTGLGLYYRDEDVATPEFDLYGLVEVITTGDATLGMIFRCETAASTYYYFRWSGSGYQLYRSTTGSLTLLTSDTADPEDGDVLKAEVRYGAAVDPVNNGGFKFYEDAVEITGCARDDTGSADYISAAGKQGLRINANAPTTSKGLHWDSLTCDDFGAAASMPLQRRFPRALLTR